MLTPSSIRFQLRQGGVLSAPYISYASNGLAHGVSARSMAFPRGKNPPLG